MQTIVILGAGWTGLPLAHKLLKYTLPKTPIQVILISPNSHFFWNVAATRGVIAGEIPDDQLFLPIEPAFRQYPVDSFRFVLGRATAVDDHESSVSVTHNDGRHEEIKYHHLVIATGSRVAGNIPLKPIGDHSSTLKAFHQLQHDINDAKSIVIAGAGPTAVEIAGELAVKHPSKSITLVCSGDNVLSNQHGVLPSVQTTARQNLETLGVKIVWKRRVVEASGEAPEIDVLLSDGSSLQTEFYLPLFGIQLNTGFLPPELLDGHGNIKLDDTMRVTSSNERNIWALGDVGNLEPKQITITDNQINHLSKALHSVLVNDDEKVTVYQPDKKALVFLSFGKKLATGQVGTWKLFGFMVVWVKGKKLFVDTAEDYVNGKRLRHGTL